MENTFKNVSPERFESAATFYMQILGLLGEVAVEFVPCNLRKIADKANRAWGWCHQDDKFSYTVEIDRTLSTKNVLTVLAHELVHVNQYYQGRLVDVDDEITTWYDQVIDTGYDSQPWELEAYTMEKILYNAFIEWEAK